MKSSRSHRNQLRPPRLAEWVFRRIFPDGDMLTTLGDLEEFFQHVVDESGIHKARLWYWDQLFRAMPHRLRGLLFLDIPMLVLSLKIMWRGLKKNKFFSFLNIFALTLGLTCFLLIFSYARYEFTHDTFHPDQERIFRIRLQDPPGSERSQFFFPIAPALEAEIPEIELITQCCYAFDPLVKVGQELHRISGLFADSNFLEVFRFPFRQSVGKPLAEPFSVVLTEIAAQRFFGNQDPMGKTLSFIIRGEPCDLTITGILMDPPNNTHFEFELLISFPTTQALPQFSQLMEATRYRFPTNYIKLHTNASFNASTEKITEFLKTHASPDTGIGCSLQPINDIHLRPDNRDNSAVRSIYLYIFLGLIILFIAGVNYVNLSTARSTIRMREIGIRKTLGAQRRQLVKQFLGEAVILSTISFALSLVLLWFIYPAFNRLLDKNITLETLFSGPLWLITLGIILFVGIGAGIYPALFLSSFQPVKVLKGTTQTIAVTQYRPSRIRNSLVIVQFTVSVVLLIVMLFIHQQVHFIRTMETGFAKENIIEAWIPQNAPAVRDRLLTNSAIQGVTTASNVISLSNRSDSGAESMPNFVHIPETGSPYEFFAHHIKCDSAFLNVFQISLLEGRNFSDRVNESHSVIVNETFARQLGPGSPLLKQVQIKGEDRDLSIVGIIRDFHFQTLHHTIKPLALSYTRENFMTLYARIDGENSSGAMDLIRKTTREINPDSLSPIVYLDDRLMSIYRVEQNQGQLLLVFSVLAVLIACLGLFGMAAFTVEQKTREISIRKVLGAGTGYLFLSLSRNSILIALIAIAAGWPLGFYFVNSWLANFVYHVPILPWTFFLTGLLVLLTVLLTSGTQLLRILHIDPVKTLKYE